MWAAAFLFASVFAFVFLSSKLGECCSLRCVWARRNMEVSCMVLSTCWVHPTFCINLLCANPVCRVSRILP